MLYPGSRCRDGNLDGHAGKAFTLLAEQIIPGNTVSKIAKRNGHRKCFAPYSSSGAFEILNGAFVFLCGRERGEGPEIFPFSGLRILFLGIEPVFT
jgi:hypothetical protein